MSDLCISSVAVDAEGLPRSSLFAGAPKPEGGSRFSNGSERAPMPIAEAETKEAVAAGIEGRALNWASWVVSKVASAAMEWGEE